MRQAFLALALLFVTARLCAQEAAPPPPVDPWTGSIGAGLAMTSGNSDTTNLNFSFATQYEPATRFLFKADALYLLGEADGEKQVDKATASARGEYSLSERTFTFGEINYLRDPFKDITYLVAPVVGAGIRLIRTDTRTLVVDGAVGMQFESNEGFGRSTSGAVKAGESFDWTISPTSKFTQKLTGLWKTDDFADALYHFDAGLTTAIAARLELKVAYAYDYKNRPPSPDVEKGDSALFAAILFKL